MKTIISQALIDFEISHTTIMNQQQKYRRLKKDNK